MDDAQQAQRTGPYNIIALIQYIHFGGGGTKNSFLGKSRHVKCSVDLKRYPGKIQDDLHYVDLKRCDKVIRLSIKGLQQQHHV